MQVKELSTQRLDQCIRMLQATQLPFFPFLQNITLRDFERNFCYGATIHNQEVLRKVFKLSFSPLKVLSRMERLCFVLMVRCGFVIQQFAHRWLITKKSFAGTQLCNPIPQCITLRHRNPGVGNYHHGNWEKIHHVSK